MAEPTEFETELSALLNRHGMDNATSTPDYLLAEFLVHQIHVYAQTMSKNIEWHASWKSGVGNG